MIIKLTGTTFTKYIGALDSYTVVTTVGTGCTPASTQTIVKKNAAYNEEFTLADGYEVGSAGITVTMGSTTYTMANTNVISVSGKKITINIASVTDTVYITITTKSIVEEEPEQPVTPTSYTFTINPDPTSATVTLSATGYSTVSGTGSKSITVANGTTVSWSVSASGYTTRTGNWTVNGGNETKSVTLTAENAEYVSYLGAEHFADVGQRVQWNTSKWVDTHSGTTSAGTELIPVSSEDSIWISKIAVVNNTLASGGFYDMNKQLVAPLFWETFGLDQEEAKATGGNFVAPEAPATIASVEETFNCSIAYVKFTAWSASDGNNTGIENTEARVYYANGIPQEPTYVSYKGEDVFTFNKQSFTDTSYTTSGSSSAYASDYLAVTPEQGVWLQYIFTMSDAHRCVGLFDSNKTFIKSLSAADFGLSTSGKFQTPSAPVKISSLEGTENVAYVRFVAWDTSDGGRANTEARIYSY